MPRTSNYPLFPARDVGLVFRGPKYAHIDDWDPKQASSWP